jgi:hypothetical protein
VCLSRACLGKLIVCCIGNRVEEEWFAHRVGVHVDSQAAVECFAYLELLDLEEGGCDNIWHDDVARLPRARGRLAILRPHPAQNPHAAAGRTVQHQAAAIRHVSGEFRECLIDSRFLRVNLA